MNSAVDKGLQKVRRALSRPDGECLGIGAGLLRADASSATGPTSKWRTVSGGRRRRGQTSRQGSILFLPADVSDIVVLFIAILDEDRTVEALLVIIVPVG
jgi:hypothetical protein